MTAIIILNIVFAAAVIVGIVGLLSAAIVGQERDGATGLARTAQRRRRSTARARVMARPASTRA
jgi:hypothetical protein